MKIVSTDNVLPAVPTQKFAKFCIVYFFAIFEIKKTKFFLIYKSSFLKWWNSKIKDFKEYITSYERTQKEFGTPESFPKTFGAPLECSKNPFRKYLQNLARSAADWQPKSKNYLCRVGVYRTTLRSQRLLHCTYPIQPCRYFKLQGAYLLGVSDKWMNRFVRLALTTSAWWNVENKMQGFILLLLLWALAKTLRMMSRQSWRFRSFRRWFVTAIYFVKFELKQIFSFIQHKVWNETWKNSEKTNFELENYLYFQERYWRKAFLFFLGERILYFWKKLRFCLSVTEKNIRIVIKNYSECIYHTSLHRFLVSDTKRDQPIIKLVLLNKVIVFLRGLFKFNISHSHRLYQAFSRSSAEGPI